MALNKLDEILAAAQQTISTNEGQGMRGQGAKRDRSRGSFYANEPNYDQSEMGMTGLGYDRAQFTSGHAPPHGMLRQKSIGEAVSLSVWPALWPACPSVCPLDS
eukprot:XP_014044332.1 PREDICTED: SH3 and multiple ankyrin repeat domains protein 1-like [Salmo salar]